MVEPRQPESGSVFLATFLAAPLAAAATSAVLLHMPAASVFAFIVALPHATLLGLPAYLFARRRGWANLVAAITFGIAVGVLPVGLMTAWTMPTFSAEDGGVWKEINGVRTAAGWIDWFKLLGFLAANGAAGGAAFWAMIRLWPANRRPEVDLELFA